MRNGSELYWDDVFVATATTIIFFTVVWDKVSVHLRNCRDRLWFWNWKGVDWGRIWVWKAWLREAFRVVVVHQGHSIFVTDAGRIWAASLSLSWRFSFSCSICGSSPQKSWLTTANNATNNTSRPTAVVCLGWARWGTGRHRNGLLEDCLCASLSWARVGRSRGVDVILQV